ncbi:MAG: prepilin-type N-terminal cleavage/methylation domain-containing protein [Gammaproteobacteria bacterium]|nr:prepilin-type N-terminal cleavage/methylation domain-containing protein [Gammaproteobacteria bacterium]
MKRHQSAGFTLIELIVVVAILGIIAAISMGYYGSYVIDANRTDARSALTRVASSLEKCKSLYSNYNSGNCNVTAASMPPTDDGYYTITGVINAADFTLTATPVAGLPQSNDTECTSLTLTHTGIKGGTPAVNECW